MKRVRAVFFDLDDTLYPARRSYLRGLEAAWSVLRSRRPIPWTAFRRRYGRARAQVKALLGDSPSARNRVLYFKRLVESLEGRPDASLILDMAAVYDRRLRTPPVPGARRVLAELSRRYLLGIVTNQVCAMQLRKLRSLDPRGEWFRVLVTSEEAGVEKPNPRLFLEACRRAGCPPAAAVVVGDSWSHDVLGALRAGLRAVHLRGAAPPRRLPAGAASVRALSEVPGALAAWDGR